ncbi:hypothetical protein GCM10009616_36150 [Microlunatus lacustris]
MTTPPPLHEEQCFSCWLTAIGADPQLVNAVLAAAFAVGVGSGAGAIARTLGLSVDQARALPSYVVLDQRIVTMIEKHVRAAMAAPASPDVAAAMNGHGHG